MFFCSKYKSLAAASSNDEAILSARKRAYDSQMKLGIALSDAKKIRSIYDGLSTGERDLKDHPLLLQFLTSIGAVNTATFEKLGCWVSKNDLSFDSYNPERFFEIPPHAPICFIAVNDKKEGNVVNLWTRPNFYFSQEMMIYLSYQWDHFAEIQIKKALELKSIGQRYSLFYDLGETLNVVKSSKNVEGVFNVSVCDTCPFFDDCLDEFDIKKIRRGVEVKKDDDESGFDIF